MCNVKVEVVHHLAKQRFRMLIEGAVQDGFLHVPSEHANLRRVENWPAEVGWVVSKSGKKRVFFTRLPEECRGEDVKALIREIEDSRWTKLNGHAGLLVPLIESHALSMEPSETQNDDASRSLEIFRESVRLAENAPLSASALRLEPPLLFWLEADGHGCHPVIGRIL